MKQYMKKFVAIIVAVGSLAVLGSAQAQSVTGTPYLSNMDPSTLNTAPNAVYAGWATTPPTTFTSLSTGLEVSSSGYGSLYYVIPAGQVQTVNASATLAQLTFTVNTATPADYNWVGTPFILNDDSGSYTYGGLYSGSGNSGNPSTVEWNGNTATWTVPLQAAQLAAVQGGSDHIYSFNLQFDPAVAPSTYDVTFNSLSIVTIPEPATMTLLGLGAAGLLIFRRRR